MQGTQINDWRFLQHKCFIGQNVDHWFCPFECKHCKSKEKSLWQQAVWHPIVCSEVLWWPCEGLPVHDGLPPVNQRTSIPFSISTHCFCNGWIKKNSARFLVPKRISTKNIFCTEQQPRKMLQRHIQVRESSNQHYTDISGNTTVKSLVFFWFQTINFCGLNGRGAGR